jgi:tRNA (guanine10-N2)-methyltransferase
MGSDLDGRSVRGKPDRNVNSNFEQYDTTSNYLGGFVADVTNTPLRERRMLHAIVCDPPYGVREGLKVLGSTKVALQEVVYLENGKPAHLQPNYIPPKRPYSFMRMLDDILDFSATRLVDGGRLCMWMPVAGDVDLEQHTEPEAVAAAEYNIPKHPELELVAVCTQDFNKWSRRLLTYRRIPDTRVNQDTLLQYKTDRLALSESNGVGTRSTADDLNAFRRKVCQTECSCHLITLIISSIFKASRIQAEDSCGSQGQHERTIHHSAIEDLCRLET